MTQNIFTTVTAVQIALLSAETKKQSKKAAEEFMNENADKFDGWYDLPGTDAQQPIAEALQQFLSFEKLEKYPELHAYLAFVECMKILSSGSLD